MSNAKEKIKEIATKEQKDAMKEMFRMVDKSKVDEVKQMLEYTQKGTAKATVGNYMVVLRNDPLVRESMKYNKLTGRIDIVKKLWWNEEVCKLDDDGRTYFYYFFERYYKLTSEKCMDKALRIEANSRAYHPICEYLEQLEWDGQERIRYVLQRYMGADASDFVYEVVKHFLMEALSRIYRPGCKADEMLCLVGQQGAGKSTFFRFLALNDDWFSDDLKQLNDSKIYEHLRGHWIMEMSEMIAAISAKSNEEIKSFLTRQKDTYRNPYDKYEEDRKRQCIFAGSTNTRQFIPFDRTGARRFLPIAIDSSKAEKHILDDEKEARSYFDQLWAEVMEIYWSTENKSSLLKFSKEMEQEISEYRKQFTQEDTMAGMIQGWLDAYKGTVLPDEIKSPKMTAEWEMALNHIAQNTETADEFLNGITELMQELVARYQGISEEKKNQFQGKAKGEVIGKCPRCGADVREGKVNFYCSDRKCAFTLWKNDKFLASQGKKMDKVAAKKFLSKGKIHYKDLVSRKTGRQYEATVEMVDPGEGNVQFNLIFPQR